MSNILTVKIRSGNLLVSHNIKIVPDGNHVLIYFPYAKELVEEIKQLPEARWVPDSKCWRVLNNERLYYSLQCLQEGKQVFATRPVVPRTPIRSTFIHQQRGTEFILQRKRVLLAFEMGTGKTLTTIEAIETAISNDHLFNWWLVAPFGAQQEWKRQLKRWNASFEFTVITTYESLKTYMDTLPNDMIPDGVVFDESVKIKNASTQRSQVAAELCRLVRSRDGYIVLLSGAPAPKNPIDWWHQVECLQPGYIREGSPYKFMMRYANVEKVDHGYGLHNEIKSWKEDELKQLGNRLSGIVLVKKKADCLDLPAKIYEEIVCPVDEELYRTAVATVELAVGGADVLEKLRQLSDGFRYTEQVLHGSTEDVFTSAPNVVRLENNPKLKVIDELLDFYNEDNGGPGRLVIYAAYHASIDMVMEHCRTKGWKAERIDGRGWSNANALPLFEDSSESNIIIVANPACVHGITLSRTHALIYYSNSFNADHRIQSEDRRDRPGMDVTRGTRIIDLLCLQTDKYILDNVKAKRSIMDISLESIKQCLTQRLS